MHEPGRDLASYPLPHPLDLSFDRFRLAATSPTVTSPRFSRSSKLKIRHFRSLICSSNLLPAPERARRSSPSVDPRAAGDPTALRASAPLTAKCDQAPQRATRRMLAARAVRTSTDLNSPTASTHPGDLLLPRGGPPAPVRRRVGQQSEVEAERPRFDAKSGRSKWSSSTRAGAVDR
jgi:hypothetical protein